MDADLDAEEVDAGIGAFVKPIQRSPMVVPEIGSHPDDDGGLEARGVHQELAEVPVVGTGQLVLDDDRGPSSVSAWMSR